MKRSIRHRTNVLIATVAFAFAIGGIGPAQASDTPDQAKFDAGQAVINGTATSGQKNLVASDPRLAATVPVTYDSSPVTLQRADVGSSASAAATAKAQCPSGTKYIVTAKKVITAKSTLGFTTFKYHHNVKYCESGTKFLKFIKRSQYFTDEDWVVDVQELIENKKSISNGRGYTKVKRKVEITNFLGKNWVIYPYIAGNFKPNDINWSGDPDNNF